MKEKQLYQAIDKLLSKDIHRQSMTGAAMTANGTPDRYYDGPQGDLWIEYKMLRNIPRDGIVVGAYTPLQLRWMERRYAHSEDSRYNSNMVGIVGLPNRTAVIQFTPQEWREGSPITNAVALKDVAAWIVAFVGGAVIASPTRRSTGAARDAGESSPVKRVRKKLT